MRPSVFRCRVLPSTNSGISSNGFCSLRQVKIFSQNPSTQQQRNLRTRPREARSIQRQLLSQIKNPSETIQPWIDGTGLPTAESTSHDDDRVLTTESVEDGTNRIDEQHGEGTKIRKFNPEQWDERVAEQYKGFNKFRSRIRHVKQVEQAVHTSLKEVFAVQQESRPAAEGFQDRESALDNSGRLASQYVQEGGNEFVHASPNAGANHTLPVSDREASEDQEVNGEVVRCPAGISEGASNEVAFDMGQNKGSRTSNTEFRSPIDQSWREMTFTDPQTKFAVLKRTAQLLGTRIPDPIVAEIHDASTLLQALLKKPKPAKLVKEFESMTVAKNSKNIRWVDGKITQHRKDVETGRLKAMEMEMDRLRLMTPKERALALGR